MTHEVLDNVSLEELAEAVQRDLSRRGFLEAQSDGRVSAAPDARTVRYYTTLGLLDRPRIVDRQARYGKRHLLQLLAIKALQGESLPLAQIQEHLYGRSDAELEALLGAVSEALGRKPSAHRLVVWRELTLEPGLKILVEEGWSMGKDPAALLERVRAAFAALSNHDKGVHR